MRSTTIARELSENGRCLIQTVGTSMEPLLHERDTTAVVQSPSVPIKRQDVVLFARRPKEESDCKVYVLHRVVKVLPEGFLVRGDNCVAKEYVANEQVLGVMTGYFTGDGYVDCEDNPWYRRYVSRLWFRYRRRQCRGLLLRIMNKVRRMLKAAKG